MSKLGHRWCGAMSAVLAAAAIGGGCGSSKATTSSTGNGFTESTSNGSGSGAGGASNSSSGSTGSATNTGGSISFNVSSSSAGGSVASAFEVTPVAMQTIKVPIGSKAPTVTFASTANGGPVKAAWAVDKGDVGTILPGPSSVATLVPTGTTGGVVTVTAGYSGKTEKRPVLIQLTGSQNGANAGNRSSRTRSRRRWETSARAAAWAAWAVKASAAPSRTCRR